MQCIVRGSCRHRICDVVSCADLTSPVAGAQEKIANLRYRHQMISESLLELEERVAKNTAELERMSHSYGDDDYDEVDMTNSVPSELGEVTDADIERELEEIRALEMKKRTLENRVSGMDRDLGELMG